VDLTRDELVALSKATTLAANRRVWAGVLARVDVPPVVTPPPPVVTTGRPFAASSPWNTPTPAGTQWFNTPVLHDPVPGETLRHWYVNERSMTVWHATAADPLVTFDMPQFVDPVFHRNRPAQSFAFRCPTAATPGTDEDHILFVVDDTTGDYVEVWQAIRTMTGIAAPGGGWARGNMRTGSGWGDLANNGGVTAANASWAGGLITGADVAANKIDHALMVALGWGLLSSTKWRAPATAPDNGGHDGPIAMGSRLGVPAGVARPAGLSPLGVAVFDALQTYGAFVVDFAGSPYPMFRLDSGTVNPGDPRILRLFTWWDSWTADMDLIGPHVRVADYQP
jgi:hypothetical protein